MAAALCLKARPTEAQLADRLRPLDGVWPDGLELYLAAADLLDLDAVSARIEAAVVPTSFAWLIEGPVDSLDGHDFDVTRQSDADQEVVLRLAELARRIDARAVNIHVIAPGGDARRLTMECHDTLLRRSVPFMERFVAAVQKVGAPFAVAKGSDGAPSKGELIMVTVRKMSGRMRAAQAAIGAPASCPTTMAIVRSPSAYTRPIASRTMLRIRNASGSAS